MGRHGWYIIGDSILSVSHDLRILASHLPPTTSYLNSFLDRPNYRDLLYRLFDLYFGFLDDALHDLRLFHDLGKV